MLRISLLFLGVLVGIVLAHAYDCWVEYKAMQSRFDDDKECFKDIRG